MARENPDSVSSKWRRIFDANPKLLKKSKNEEAVRLYEEANPGEKIDEKKLGVMANVKSQMRKKHKIAGRATRAAKSGAPKAASTSVAVAEPRPSRSHGSLESLEEMIDQSLDLAKRLDAGQLGDVAKLLKRARNRVIILAGE